MPGRAPAGRAGNVPGPGRGPPGPTGPPGRGAKAPGTGRGPPSGPPAAGRGAAGRGGMPGKAPPGRGGNPAGEPGRGGMLGAATPVPAAAGRGAAGRGGMLGVPSSGEEVKGLLPGRGPGAAGRKGAGASSSAGAGAADVSGAAAAAAGLGAAFLAGAGAAGAAAAAAAWAGKASRTLRATGGSMVEEALLTNSPFSFNHARRALLSRPSSFASSWTRALPGTVLLHRRSRPGSCPGLGCYCMVLLIWWCSSRAHAFSTCSPVDDWICCTCSLTAEATSGPDTRRARGNARRPSARSTHANSGCTNAPRPGRRPAGSAVRTPSTTTTRSRAGFTARTRQPTHVRTGPEEWATGESTALSR